MRIRDLFVMGLKSLSRRKARTILTVLGVVIGSLSIIIMRSIGYGMQNNFETTIMQQGSLTTITIYTWGDVYDSDGNWLSSKQQVLNDALVSKIRQIEHVKAVSPVVEKFVTLMKGKYRGWAHIIAMKRETFEAFDFPETQFGTYPTDEDNSQIIFGYYTPYEFRDWTSRTGKSVEVDLQKDKIELLFDEYQTDPKKKEFRLPLKNITKMVETNGEMDGNVYMDLDYLKEIYRKYCSTLSMQDRKRALKSIQEYNMIKLNVDNIKNVVEVQDKIKEELGFQSYSDMQYLVPLQKTSRTLQMVLGALGLVAMVVSAISIANTMVMSIYERTKEIGIMKVLGCIITDIRKLFLFEAAIIGLFGGVIGIILGYIASWIINKFGGPIFSALMSGNYMYDMTNTKFSIIPFYLPFASLLLSVAVGLLSGYFPARRATKISAIEAMKTEG